MTNEEWLKKREELYQNTLVLDCFKVKLFKNVRLDLDDDYYYTLVEERTNHTYLHSAVGRMIFLKEHLPEPDYEYIKLVWNNNNEQKAV